MIKEFTLNFNGSIDLIQESGINNLNKRGEGGCGQCLSGKDTSLQSWFFMVLIKTQYSKIFVIWIE